MLAQRGKAKCYRQVNSLFLQAPTLTFPAGAKSEILQMVSKMIQLCSKRLYVEINQKLSQVPFIIF